VFRPALPRQPGSLAARVEDLVAAAPPLTGEQRDKLALLLRTRPPRVPHPAASPGELVPGMRRAA
jgi:hypothetical protein